MTTNNYYTIKENNTTGANTTGLKFILKNLQPDSTVKSNKDTTHSTYDSIVIKDTIAKKIKTNPSDSLQLQITDTVSLHSTQKFTKHLELIPLKPRFFYTDIPSYKPFDVNSLTTQKYTNIKIEDHYLPGKNYMRPTTDWMVIVGIVSLIVLGWVYGFFKKYLVQLFQSAYNSKISFKLMEERSSITERVSFALNVLFVLNSGLFIFELLSTFKATLFGLNNFPLYALLVGIITVIYLFKYILYSFIGFVLNASWEISEIIHSIFLYNKIFGIFLIPILIFIPFIDETQARYLAFTGIFLFAISLLFRIFRGFQISMKINFSIFYLILYLCAFEILPLLIIGKFFYKLINS